MKVNFINGPMWVKIGDSVFVTPGPNYRDQYAWTGTISKIGNKYLYVSRSKESEDYCFHIDSGYEKCHNQSSARRLWSSESAYNEHTKREALINKVYAYLRDAGNKRMTYGQAYQIATVLNMETEK